MTAMMKETDIAADPPTTSRPYAPTSRSCSRQVYGKPLVYLDNGASAQKPRAVLEAMDYAYRNEYANVHRGLHFLSNAATAKLRGRARDRAPLPQCRQASRRSSSRAT